MEFISSYITELLTNYAVYLPIFAFGLLLLAGLNLPVSEDLVFIISSSIAATTQGVNVYLTFIGCFFGAYFSDIIAFSIGKYAGNKLINYPFFQKMIPAEKIDGVKGYFLKYGGKTLFFGRFIPFGVRNLLFMTSGLIKMKVSKFLMIDILALSVTSTILFSLGYTLGNNRDKIFPYLSQYKFIIFGIFIMIIFSSLFYKKFKTKV